MKALEGPTVPVQNLLTLQYLLRHLDTVCQHSSTNGLDPRATAAFFGPLLLQAPATG